MIFIIIVVSVIFVELGIVGLLEDNFFLENVGYGVC